MKRNGPGRFGNTDRGCLERHKRAVSVLQRLFETLQNLRICLRAVIIFQRLPHLGLRGLENTEQKLGLLHLLKP